MTEAATPPEAGEPAAPRKRRDRRQTEGALMAAALRLLERDGVLAGLNLQEVADEAGVNRGLIHHYFGTRRALLRAAIERSNEQIAPNYRQQRELPPAEKGLGQFIAFAQDSRYLKLIALLALDGDDQFEPIMFLGDRVADLQREQAAGTWAADVDLLAFIALWDTFIYGYFLLRDALARQLGWRRRELDGRVLAVLDRMVSAVRLPASERDPADGNAPGEAGASNADMAEPTAT